jgi:hypothetical protein
VGAGADRPGIPGVLAAWVRPGEPGDILRDDAELLLTPREVEQLERALDGGS